ncbi:hypothetical protein TWF225_002810 [Orbilia oligospora]|nr:hypothetical protein TWF225_002810 [Orbilia oligospora]KAF3249376.1 hypothetical protein TWF128_007808 [Orbilia oligospora]KAF3263829.1 hypothetical protein TWF217_003536 [Orbilia oligospora]
MKMSTSPIDTIPSEILTQILSSLPITSQVAAYQVCSLWRALLVTPQLQASRYQLFPRSDSSISSVQQAEPIYVHQLLYNEIPCANSACSECNERLLDYEYICGFPRSEGYYPDSVTRYLQAYLLGILGPDQKISTYELRIKSCVPLDNSSSAGNHIHIPISSTHPFLNEPVLAPISRRNMKKGDLRRFPWLLYVRTPGLQIGVAPKDNELCVSASTNIREFTLRAWEMMREAMSEDTTAIWVEEKMYRVRFAFPTHHRGEKGPSKLPMLQFDLEAGEIDFSIEEEKEDEEEEPSQIES